MARLCCQGLHRCRLSWVPSLLLALLLRVVEGRSWTIASNAFRSYFNLPGDASEALKQGAKVQVGGQALEVLLSQYFEDQDQTYVQLDQDHGASVGDTVSMVSAGSSGRSTTSRSVGGSSASASQAAAEDDEDYEDDDAAPASAPAKAKSSRSITSKPANDEFEKALPFVEAVSVEDVTAAVRKQQKPGVVFVTQPWCGACKHMKGSIASSDSIKRLLRQFVVAHAVGDDGAQWQSGGKQDSYIPRLYFLDPSGERMDISGPNAKFSHFFQDAQAVEKALSRVLAKLGKTAEL